MQCKQRAGHLHLQIDLDKCHHSSISALDCRRIRSTMIRSTIIRPMLRQCRVGSRPGVAASQSLLRPLGESRSMISHEASNCEGRLTFLGQSREHEPFILRGRIRMLGIQRLFSRSMLQRSLPGANLTPAIPSPRSLMQTLLLVLCAKHTQTKEELRSLLRMPHSC